MMQPTKLLLISVFTFFLGLALFAWHRSWFIISFPERYAPITVTQGHTTSKKTVSLFFWHDHRSNQDKVEIITSEQPEESLEHLITAWLRTLGHEQVDGKEVTLQSVALNNAGTELLISFDRNPFNKQWSTFEKLMWVEALCKTVRTFNTQLTHIRLLVGHQPLIDPHLDFTNPWPITGFSDISN